MHNKGTTMKQHLLNFFRLSKKEYFADFFITPTITLIYGYFSFVDSPAWLGMVFLGIFIWTFYEYFIHRIILHHFFLMKDVHNLHHDNQKDYIAIPPWFTLMNYIFFFLVFGKISSALMVGFSVGYIIYASLHSIFHYIMVPHFSPLFFLKRHHSLHHFDGKKNFGVSTTLWDRVFKTYITKI